MLGLSSIIYNKTQIIQKYWSGMKIIFTIWQQFYSCNPGLTDPKSDKCKRECLSSITGISVRKKSDIMTQCIVNCTYGAWIESDLSCKTKTHSWPFRIWRGFFKSADCKIIYNISDPFLGCFLDKEKRLMTSKMHVDKKLTRQRCINFCRRTGYIYAGVEVSLPWNAQECIT